MNNKIKHLELKELKNFLKESKNNFLVVFYADWCPYCTENIPQIIQTVNNEKIKNFLLINITDDSLDVWKEDGNTEWAIQLVPTTRVYKKNEIIYEHKNVITQKELVNVIKKFEIN